MSRFINILLCIMMAALLAVLYHVRYAADAQIRAIRILEREQMGQLEQRKVMQAEWVSLNDPLRLEDLSNRHLKMHPPLAEQMSRKMSTMNYVVDYVAPLKKAMPQQVKQIKLEASHVGEK